MKPVDNNPALKPAATESEPRTGGVRTDKSSDATPAKPAQSGAGESVSVTPEAAGMLALEQDLQRLPEVDRQRVESIRQSIADGSYRPDTDKIIDNLMRLEHELY